MTETGNQLLLLFYDEECPVCRASVRAILRLAPRSPIRPVGLRTDLARRSLPDASSAERLQAFHVVDADGHHWKGPSAIPPLLEAVRLRSAASLLHRIGVGRTRTRSPLAFRTTGRAYHWVTRNRGWMGRFIPRSLARPLRGPEPPERPV